MKYLKIVIFAFLLTTALSAAPQKASVVSTAYNSNNELHIRWAQSGTVALQLYSISGKVVKSISRLSIKAGNELSFSLNDIANGVYYIAINTGNNIEKIAISSVK